MQRVAAVLAPKLLGGTAARTPLGDLGLTALAQAWRARPSFATSMPRIA